MIIGITGQPPAGSGKDTVADYLVKEFGFVKMGIADPMKRIVAEVYGWTEEDLWGPSENRDVPDVMYPRSAAVSGIRKASHLTPRFALQRLGSNWGRDCYENTWIDLCMRTVRKLQRGDHYYSRVDGLRFFPGNYLARGKTCVVIPDVRFDNEAAAIKKAGGKIWLVDRPNAGLEGDAAKHDSEVGVGPECVDFVIKNDKGIDWLHQQACTLVNPDTAGQTK